MSPRASVVATATPEKGKLRVLQDLKTENLQQLSAAANRLSEHMKARPAAEGEAAEEWRAERRKIEDLIKDLKERGSDLDAAIAAQVTVDGEARRTRDFAEGSACLAEAVEEGKKGQEETIAFVLTVTARRRRIEELCTKAAALQGKRSEVSRAGLDRWLQMPYGQELRHLAGFPVLWEREQRLFSMARSGSAASVIAAALAPIVVKAGGAK